MNARMTAVPAPAVTDCDLLLTRVIDVPRGKLFRRPKSKPIAAAWAGSFPGPRLSTATSTTTITFLSRIGTLMILDFAPKGRNEQSTMDSVRRHDEYEKAPKALSCCG